MSLDKYRRVLARAEDIDKALNHFDAELDCFEGVPIERVRYVRREWERVVFCIRHEVMETERKAIARLAVAKARAQMNTFTERLDDYTRTHDYTDRCVYCGKPDCDKIALPDLSYIDHPDRNFAPGDMCHDECEKELMR